MSVQVNFDLSNKTLLQRSGLVADFRNGVDNIGESIGPVQPGRGYTGDGMASIAIAGLLTTDTITADSTDVPTCTADGTLNIADGDVVWGVTITRDDVVIGYFPCAEGSGTLSINTKYEYGTALHHGTISSDTIHTELANGAGYDLNLNGFAIAGSNWYVDENLNYPIEEGAYIPIVDGMLHAYVEV